MKKLGFGLMRMPLTDPNNDAAVDVEQVLRYFVVHNYVVNSDSYTGSMVHNYYLYEEDGKLSMIPWDYNLAFGTFMGGSASSSVNDPIDSPLSASGSGDRPMIDWFLSDETYLEQYHQYFAEFLETVDVQAMIEETAALIAPYVENDATAFCTYEEFTQGVAAMQEFCALRTESVEGQLAGTIPATDAGQSADSSALVDCGDLNLSAMGTMGGTMGGGMGSRPSGGTQQGDGQQGDTQQGGQQGSGTWPNMGSFDMSQLPEGMENFDPPQMPGGMGGMGGTGFPSIFG